MEEKELSHKGKKIFYRTIGSGPLVVLLHGVPFDGSLWSNQYNAFANYKLVIPDLPGSGRSDMIDDMSMEGMAETVKEIIVHETAMLYFKSGEPEGAIVIGHSMGGYVTLALAAKYPQMLNGFGLFHSTAYADSDEKKGTRQKTIDTIRQNGIEAFIQNAVPNLFSATTKNDHPEIIEGNIRSASTFSPDAIIHYYQAMMQRPDRTPVLKNSRVPVLFILGKYDNAVPLKDGLEQCSMPDIAYIHILENAAHTGMSEQPAESNSILSNYLKHCHHAP